MTRKAIIILGCLAVFAGTHPAMAEQKVVPLPTDNRLVQFVYDQDNTYTILTRPGDITDIQLADDEKLQAMAMGDKIRWVVGRAAGHVFIKPTESDLVTSATMVTDRRTYQLTLRSGPLDGRWYQRVSWTDPDLLVVRDESPARTSPRQIASPAGFQPADQSSIPPIVPQPRIASTADANSVNVEKLNFNYTITGDASFKPVQVFDDGTFTWLKLPEGVQTMPAVFIIPEDGAKAQIPNFNYRGNFLVVQRRAYQIILRIGEQEVRVNQKKGFWD